MPEEIMVFVWLCLAALAAGVVNSLAGGGTLLTFPTLIAALVPLMTDEQAKVVANATSTVALVTGSVAGAWGYRKEVEQVRHWLLVLIGPSLVGGVLGALLLTELPGEVFSALVPWLVLTATLLFLAEPLLRRPAGEHHVQRARSARAVAQLAAFQLFLSIYGGYFGAGIGILMISGLTLMGVGHIHQINALKTILAACINSVAVVVFVVQGKVFWKYALPMAVAAILGGYIGARGALRIPRAVVRWLVIVIGFGLTLFFFLH
jgi:uncharacterized membrane protein YfcA